MNSSTSENNWRVTILAILGTIATLFMALLMAQQDSLPRLLRPTTLPLAQITATATVQTILPLPTATLTLVPTVTNTPATETAVLVPACGTIPENWIAYTVRPGDNLFRLATNTGATISEIKHVNCLELDLLVSGMQIYLPQHPPTRIPCLAPAHWQPYTIQPGDTLFSLSRRFNTTIYQIKQANCLEGTRLLAGKRILLPPAPATATFTPIPPTATFTPLPPPPATSTNTPTPTAIPTFTATPSATATTTATPALTPTPSATSTFTPTATATSQPTTTTTATPGITATATITAVPTITNTPTITPPPSTST
ncbi:MAG: LysM peptidoglycan-binding domain-containing protein, partial [Chloroflexi bacterium]